MLNIEQACAEKFQRGSSYFGRILSRQIASPESKRRSITRSKVNHPLEHLTQLLYMDASESQPLLQHNLTKDNIVDRVLWQRWLPTESSYVNTSRTQIQRFLISKTGHYAVLLLVALDVSCIFAGTLFWMLILDANRLSVA